MVIKAYRPKAAGGQAGGAGGGEYRLQMQNRMARAEGGGEPARPEGPKGPMLHVGPIHSPVAGRTDHLPMHVPSGAYVLPADIVSAHGEGNSMAGFKVMRRVFGGTPYGAGKAPYGHKGGPYGKAGAPYDQGAGPYGEKLEHAKGGRVHVRNTRTGEIISHAWPRKNRTLQHVRDLLTPSWKGDEHAGRAYSYEIIPEERADCGQSEGDKGVPIIAAGGEFVLSPEEVRRVGGGDLDLGHRVLDEFVKRSRKELIKTLQKLPGPVRD